MPLIENIPSAPGFVKTFKDGRRRKLIDLNLFNHPFPRRFGVSNKLIPNLLLDLRLMPLFMIEHFVIAFDPDVP